MYMKIVVGCILMGMCWVAQASVEKSDLHQQVAYLRAIKDDGCVAASDHVSDVLEQMGDLSGGYVDSGGPLEVTPALSETASPLPESSESSRLSLVLEAYQQCANKPNGPVVETTHESTFQTREKT
jgi:hypothetical protein